VRINGWDGILVTGSAEEEYKEQKSRGEREQGCRGAEELGREGEQTDENGGEQGNAGQDKPDGERKVNLPGEQDAGQERQREPQQGQSSGQVGYLVGWPRGQGSRRVSWSDGRVVVLAAGCMAGRPFGILLLVKNYRNREDFGLWCHCERFVRSNLMACGEIASSQRTLLAMTARLVAAGGRAMNTALRLYSFRQEKARLLRIDVLPIRA